MTHIFIKTSLLAICLLASCASEVARSTAAPAPRPWAEEVNQEVRAMGAGNWIVIAEASFPVHSRRGVRTLLVDGKIPEVLDQVVGALEYSDSVKPYFTTASELPYVRNERAPGIDTYRGQLKIALHGHGTREMDYRSLGLLLENEANKFAVLVLKTKTALPYTSVFIELHSNYWDVDNERALRRKMEERAKKDQTT